MDVYNTLINFHESNVNEAIPHLTRRCANCHPFFGLAMTGVIASNAPGHGGWRKVTIGDTMIRAVYLLK